MIPEHKTVSVNHQLTRIFITLLLLSIAFCIVGMYMTTKYNTEGLGIVECHGGFAHCAHLHPVGALLAWGGIVTNVGFVGAGVSFVGILSAILSSVKRKQK